MISTCPSCAQSYELADEQVMGTSLVLSCPPCNLSWVVGPIEPMRPLAADVDDDDITAARYEPRASRPAPQPSSVPARPSSVPARPSSRPSSVPQRPMMASEVPTTRRSSIPARPSSRPSTAPAAPVSTSEAAARRVGRGADREHRDLFATRPPSEHPHRESSVVPPPPPSPSMFPSGGTGARDEHSLLFSVEDLRRRSTMPPPAPAPSFVAAQQRMGEDDGGVIDLKPMLSAGGAVKSRSEPLYTPVTEAAGMGFALSVPPPHKQPWFVFGAAAASAVVFLAVALGVALHGSAKNDEESASSTRSGHVVAAVQPQSETVASAAGINGASDATGGSRGGVIAGGASDPTTDAVAAAAPVKAQTVSTHAPAAARTSGGAKGWKMPASTQKVQSGGSTFTPKPSAAPTPPKAKGSGGGKRGGAGDPCGCGGNLACAMKCGI